MKTYKVTLNLFSKGIRTRHIKADNTISVYKILIAEYGNDIDSIYHIQEI